MKRAKDIMSCNVVTVDIDDTIDYAVSLLVKHEVSGLPVLDKTGRVVGIISEFDLLELICDGRTARDKICHYMSTEVCSVTLDDDWVDVADMFRSNHIRRLPVTSSDQLVGIISRHDLMRAIQDARMQIRQQWAQATRPPVRLNSRVLLVAGRSLNERFLSLALKRAGADVTVAEDGQVAVKKVLTALPDGCLASRDMAGPFDLILMDMEMVGMSGYDATRQLREGGYIGTIIAATAYATDEARRRCLDAGCDNCVTKPIDRQVLIDLVAKHSTS